MNGMELQECPSICGVHGGFDGDGGLEGWRSERKKCFRIEWEPTTQRKSGRASDMLWGTLRVHMPYVIFRGVEEPCRIGKLISEDVVNDVVGYSVSEKRAEEYIK